jgi:signal transduction histidine kinase
MPVPFQEIGGSIAEISAMYEETFLRVMQHPNPENFELQEQFTSLLSFAKNKHLATNQLISQALRNVRCTGTGEWRDPKGRLLYVDDPQRTKVQEVIQRFYNGRIALRLLVDQHIALRRDVLELPDRGSVPGDVMEDVWRRILDLEKVPRRYWGIVHPECSVKTVLDIASQDAQVAAAPCVSQACGKHMVDEIEIKYRGDLGVAFSYVPEHLYIMLSEVLANAIRVTAERHGPTLSSGGSLPPVTVTVTGGSHIFIRITDQGGGVAYASENKESRHLQILCARAGS